MDANLEKSPLRWRVNAISLVLSCVFLVFAVQLSDGGSGFAKNINRITDTLDRAVLSLSSSVNYTDPPKNAYVYHNQTRFEASGMAGLYKLTRMFVDLVYPQDVLMDGIISVENSEIKLNSNIDYGEVAKYYVGLLVVVIILVVLAVFFPLCGLCFCLCRCCGKCGARSQPSGKKKDLCAKLVQGTLLIVLATGLLFCVVCAFGSSHQLNQNVNTFTNDVKKSVDDSKSFLNNTQSEANHLLNDNYNEFAIVFFDTLDKSSDIVVEKLEDYSNATKMTILADFVKNIPEIRTTFSKLKANTNQLRVYASQLNDAIRKVKKDLIGVLNNCNLDACKEIQKNISQLNTQIDFNKLPDFNEQIKEISNIPLGDIQKAAEQGTAALEHVRTEISNVVKKGIDQARNQIYNANTSIQDGLNQMDKVVDDVRTQITNNADKYLKQADKYINEYWQYVYYAGLGISCVLLLVTICIAFGLTCGICGKRPDGYGDNCCNKGAGGQFLICAVMFMLFSGFFLAVLTLAMFLAGTASDKVVCANLRNPDPDQSNLIALIDKMLDENTDIDLKISEVIQNCHSNKSLYETFNIKKQFNIEEIIKNLNISSYVKEIKESFNSFSFEDLTILSEPNRQKIEELMKYDLDNNLDKFTDELTGNFTNANLDEIIAELNNVIIKLQAIGQQDELVAELQLSVLHINTYNEKLLIPMKNMADDVLANVNNLLSQLKMDSNSFPQAIESLLDEIDSAEKTLKTEGADELKRIANNFTDLISSQVQSYIDRVTHQVQYEIGKCGPLSSAVNSTLTTTCDKVLQPWNGFWFSMFLTLLLYVVTVVVAVKLASLYQKYKPYGQGYVETEYLYDAYADRADSIPLNSGRNAKRGKKKGKKSKRYEERVPNGEVVAREYTSGAHPPDARYADMAPKHWEEFPNGGPPQYQRAPTEYERPPPYYYPGNAGDH